jgi:beta-glucan synthesis-associated protein KRE6
LCLFLFFLKQLQWPYSYDSCDVGTLPNQTYPGLQTPLAAVENGDPEHDNVLVRGYSSIDIVHNSTNNHPWFIMQSLLPGQRLSACTCPGESHPGPQRQDGSYVGRSSPEIDLFEALVSGNRGQVSQSAQWAPFNVSFASQ